MAEPKKKLSKTRTNLRRAQYKATALPFVKCSNCGETIRSHIVCPHCNFYKGVSVKPKATKRIVVDK
ncbi:50S ribosomal protein L32 [Candidatus Berkelbacteria bacterium]|nr:50S ribosomal protein L32 [Candidatus Berkelbacteria bacterium]